MDLFGIGPAELLLIFIFALIFLGPRRLPEIARQVGKAMGDLQRASTELRRELNVAIQEENKNSQDGSSPNLQPRQAVSLPSPETPQTTAAGTANDQQ